MQADIGQLPNQWVKVYENQIENFYLKKKNFGLWFSAIMINCDTRILSPGFW